MCCETYTTVPCRSPSNAQLRGHLSDPPSVKAGTRPWTMHRASVASTRRPNRPGHASRSGFSMHTTMRAVGATGALRRRPVAVSALAVSAVLAALAALLIAFGPLARAAGPIGAGYWHTSGNQILDSNGNPVRIAGINWYGFETPDEIAHGLWSQDYHAVVDDIKRLGYNTIRIPISNQAVETPVVPQNLAFNNNAGPINTDLKGLNALQDLQKIV